MGPADDTSGRRGLSLWAPVAVAVFCVGSCVGNVFVFRRFAAGFRFRYDPSTTTAARETGRAVPRQPSPSAVLPAAVLADLRTLRLPATRPRPAEVKAAYRALALECHPDRLAADDPLRVEKTRRFDEATGAHRRLRRFLSEGAY